MIAIGIGRPLLLTGALMTAAATFDARQPAWSTELPTRWETPPGDPLEHMTAGFAKILCSALFITGRELATAQDEDGFFVSPRAERGKVQQVVVNSKSRAVHLTLPNGVTRAARLYGDQGCVTLPRGAESVSFTPVKVDLVAAGPGDATLADGRPATRHAASPGDRPGKARRPL